VGGPRRLAIRELRIAPAAHFCRSRSQAVAADGQAGVVRRDAIGLLAGTIGLRSGAIALRGGAIEDSWRAEGADLMEFIPVSLLAQRRVAEAINRLGLRIAIPFL
jgi:hypothetical protein